MATDNHAASAAVLVETVASAALLAPIVLGVLGSLAGCGVRKEKGPEVGRRIEYDPSKVPDVTLVKQMMVNGKLIKAGMSYDTVVGLLGEPFSIKEIQDSRGRITSVGYPGRGTDWTKAFRLEFDDGLDGPLSRLWYVIGL